MLNTDNIILVENLTQSKLKVVFSSQKKCMHHLVVLIQYAFYVQIYLKNGIEITGI